VRASSPNRRGFSGARWSAIFLSLGGLLWTVFFVVFGPAALLSWQVTGGLVIVVFWIIRACDFGAPALWIGFWVLSILWHVIYLVGGLGELGIGMIFGGPLVLALFIAPLLWIIYALVFSVRGLIDDLRRPRNA
jgi:hypothetical protein